MYQAKSGVKKFSLYQWGWRGVKGGSLDQKNFFQSEDISSQIWCQKLFPLLGWGVLSQKFFFSSLNMYQAKSGVKFFSLLPVGRGGPLTKIFFFSLNMYQVKSSVEIFSFYCWGESLDKKVFFPVWRYIKPNLVSKFFPLTMGGEVPQQKFFFFFSVWTCIKPNLVSKIFPFTVGGGSFDKKFFFQSEHVSSQIWCQNFFLLLWEGGPSTKIFFSSLNMYQTKSGVKIFSLYWWGGVPLQKFFFSSLNMYQTKSAVKNFSLYWDRVPSPPGVDWHTKWKYNLPSSFGCGW